MKNNFKILQENANRVLRRVGAIEKLFSSLPVGRAIPSAGVPGDYPVIIIEWWPYGGTPAYGTCKKMKKKVINRPFAALALCYLLYAPPAFNHSVHDCRSVWHSGVAANRPSAAAAAAVIVRSQGSRRPANINLAIPSLNRSTRSRVAGSAEVYVCARETTS